MKPTQVLVPTDFSHESNLAQAFAVTLAEATGATLHVLHVIPDPLIMGWGVDAGQLPQVLERTEQTVRDQLDKTLTPEVRAKLRAQFAVETGAPVAKIVEYAKNHKIDHIVMGTHGRGVVERMWVGSVTQGVLQRATCPVTAVRNPSR